MKMDDESNNGKGFAASWSLSAKPCDSCKSSSALLFCRADSAFLCIGCDSKIHTANKLASRHERVWMCEVCEQAPASVTCKADAAALCVTCDRDIHSANPLARRHERFPVVPFYESAASALKSNSMNLLVPDGNNGSIKDDQDNNDEVEVEVQVDEEDEEQDQREEAEAASWLLTNPNLVNNHKPPPMETPDLNCADQYFFSDIDPYLDLDYTTSSMASGGRFPHHHHHSGTTATTDSVVPVQPEPHHHLHTSLLHPELDFCRSKPSYSYTTPSLSQSVSSSSMDVGVVPDGNNSDISNAFMNNNGMESVGMGSVAVSAQACQLTGMDREARVLRYREKRKNRKFEKTIRYASRKAYAETRPRIKGRFAKRTELEAEVDRLYSSAASLMADASGYGIVPSF